MNILLWILQDTLAFLCLSGGFYKVLQFDTLQKGVVAMQKLPKALWMLFGVIEVLAGVALIVPGAFDILPSLTVLAASVLAIESLVISGLYLKYADKAPIPFSVAIAVMAVVIAYGRFAISPF